MRNIEIIRGYREAGHEDVYAADPLVNVTDGHIIFPDGTLATLTDTHLELGVSIQPTNLGSTEYREASGKIPVYLSNFSCRTKKFTAGVYQLNDPVSVKDGLPIVANGTNAIVWGYVTKVGTDGTLDIRVNY